MTATLETTLVTINLEGACIDRGCSDLAFRFRNQLGVPNYSNGASVMELPDSLLQWRQHHRTARKRADRGARLGYRFDIIDRSQFNDDIHDINTSLSHRQGRPMAAGYHKQVNHRPLPDYPCDRHRVHTYGVLQNARLRAYATLYRVGDLALVSMILGHGEHLRNDVMYLLAAGFIADQVPHGGYLYYNRHDSGTDGLVYYKERLGFHAADITWTL
jgi:hypothetical protein